MTREEIVNETAKMLKANSQAIVFELKRLREANSAKVNALGLVQAIAQQEKLLRLLAELGGYIPPRER